MMQLSSPQGALPAGQASALFDQEPRAALTIAADQDVTLLLRDAGATLAPLAAAVETLRDLDIPSADAIYQGVARLGAILRCLGASPGPRAVHDATDVLVFDPFRLDVTNETLWRGDAKLYLPAKPFTILRYLAERPRRLVRRDELLLGAWGNVVRSDSLLRTHIRGLRQVLGRGIIETVIGRGYRFAIDVTRVVEPSPSLRGPSVWTLA